MRAKKIIIPFKGLKEGVHHFNFEIGSDFLSSFENGEVQEGDVGLKVELTKRVQLLVIECTLAGNVTVACDRCLEEFNLDINFNGKLYVKFGEEKYDNEDDIIVISPNDHEVDLSHYIYECIHLSLPYKRIHPDKENGESGCNKDMINKLNEHKVEEDKENDQTDPRWEQLKKIITNN